MDRAEGFGSISFLRAAFFFRPRIRHHRRNSAGVDVGHGIVGRFHCQSIAVLRPKSFCALAKVLLLMVGNWGQNSPSLHGELQKMSPHL